jgi:hypothetical protein
MHAETFPISFVLKTIAMSPYNTIIKAALAMAKG